MSDYDILPKNMPDTTSELADRFDTALPEASFENDYSQLTADIYELFLDPADITHQPSGRPANNSTPPDENKKQQLRDFIEEALNKKLPQLMEFHRKGYNPVSLDRNALQKLQDILHNERLNIPESLRQPARRFVDTLNAVAGSEAALSPDLLQASDTVLQHLRAALDDLSATRKISKLNWEEEAEQTAREARGQLVTRAAERLFPQQGQAAEREKSRQTLDSLLFAQSSALSAEYKKFSLLKASLVAESRLTRQRLAAHLQTRAHALIQGAREARRAALDMLLTESGTGQMHPEQLMHWSQGYQQYAGYLRAVDARPDTGAVEGNPLITAVNRAARQGKSVRARLAGSMVPLADALGSVAVHLLQEKQRTEPAPADPQPGQKKTLTERIKNVVWDKGRKKGRAVRATSAWLAQSAGGTVSRAAFRTKHTLQRTPPLSEGTRQAISNTALLLLDEIQQAERRLRLLPGYAWVRQEAVQQQLLLSREIADPHESALMDEVVSRRLALESDHWQQIADNAARQIEALLSPLTRLAETTWFNEFYFALSDELRARPTPGSAEAISRMDETVIQATEQLAGLGRQLNAAAVRLSGHGHEGGKALQEKAGHWLMTLKTLKSQVKTQAIQLTGQAPDNFSRSGMLARGIAEWAQTLRQDYLAGLTGDERTRANVLFDQLLTELLSGHRQHFAGPDDPQAESLLKRVAIALKHTAEGTTVYPPTAEEILAGTRTISADVQHWAEKKILTGALSAAISGGLKLLTGPVSLPVRIALRGAKTGWTLNRNFRAMNRVRLGEGPASERVKNRLFHQEMSKLAFRLTLSLSPAGGYGVAATLVGSQMIKGQKTYAQALAKKVVVDLPQEALWYGLAYGGYAGVNAVVRASAERAMQKALEQAAHARRERINHLIQQFSLMDVQEEEVSESEELADDTETELSAETVDEAITEDRDASEEKAVETTAAEGETPATATIDQATKNKKKVPLLSRSSRVKRFAPGGVPPKAGIPSTSTSVTPDNKILASQASDSLKDLVNKVTTRRGFWNPNLKNGEEGAVYSTGSQFYIYINGNYWPIHFKDNQRGVVTINPYAKENEIKIEVHLEKKIWLATATENAKNNYPPLPIEPVTLVSEGDKAVTDPDKTASQKATSSIKLSGSTASSELYQQANTWPIDGAFFYSNMIRGKEAQIYRDSESQKNYIYLNSLYWPVILTGNSTATIVLNNNDPQQKKIINLRKINQQWGLAQPFNSSPLPVKTMGNFSIEAYINAFFDIKRAAKVTSEQLQNSDDGLFLDKSTSQHYIQANGYYWYVNSIDLRGAEELDTWKIHEAGGREHLNIIFNDALGAWIPLQTTEDEYETDNNITPNVLSADIIDEMKKWDLDSSVRPVNSGPGEEGKVYQDKTGNYYIYLQNRYWHFSWLKINVGGVTITTSGVRKFIILRKYDNEWQYFDEENIKESFNLGGLLDDISDAFVDKETEAALDSLLWSSGFISLDNFLQDLQKILENAFYRLYEQPSSDELRNIILLSNSVSDLQKSLAYYSPDNADEKNIYKWNEDLLALYTEEFSGKEEQSSYIYAARQARVAAEEAKKRVAQSGTEKIDQQLKENIDELAKLKDKWFYWATLPETLSLDYNVQIAQSHLDSLKPLIDALEIKIKQLNTLKKQLSESRTEYQKAIDNYEKNYRLINNGIDLAKSLLANERKNAGINDNLKIKKSVMIYLTLQKIAIRNSAVDAYTEVERDQLKILSVAQTMINQLIERQSLSEELIEKIHESSVRFPPLKHSYQDIEWSNTEAERIYNEKFPADDNEEANQLLAPLLYWLLKNKRDYNALRAEDIDTIIDAYYTDAYSLNPLKQIKKMPPGYTPLAHLLGREYFTSDSDYYQQFIDYKENFSTYEASENAKNLLLASDLSLNEISSKVKKRFYFNVLQSTDVYDTHEGGILFIELDDGRWVFFSLFPESLFSRIFSREEMMANIWLKTIATLTPEQTHYHGIQSVFLESFFIKNFDPKNKNILTGKYHKIEARKKKEFEDFIVNTLYKSSDDITYTNPFKDRAYYGLTYDFSLNSEQPQETLLETLNKAFRDVLNRSATNRKTALYQSTMFQKIADIVVPFYAEIRGAINDPEYNVNATSIMLDVIGVCFVASQAGTKASALLKNAKQIGQIIGEGTKKGFAGRGLQKYVIKEMGKEGLINAAQLSKISVNALLDLVLPINVESLLKKSAPKKNLLSAFDKILGTTTPEKTTRRGIDSKYINKEISFDDLTPTTEHGVNVYISRANGEGKDNYYIKSDENIYQIRWDDYAQTWRTVDPKNPGRFSYGEPIVFEDGKWVINKNYGGLRGGGITDPDIIMGEMPQREDFPLEKVKENLISTGDVDAQAHLNELKKDRELNSAILSPNEKCESVIYPVGKYMEEKGFTDIRCRAMAFYVNGMDDRPGNHFLLIGTKKGRDYAFDITAGQFQGQFEELNGPIIMPEDLWAQKYGNVTSERKLLIYADYPFKDISDAKNDFSAYSKYLSQGPNCRVPNAKVIKRPVWYYSKKPVDDFPAAAPNKKAGGTPRFNPVRQAARRSVLTTQNASVSWDYATEILENAELLAKGPAATLRTGLRQASRYQRDAASSSGAVDDLFSSSQVITSQENLLHVKQGEILVFMEVAPDLASKGPRPIHVMVSLGNGRFAGVKNGVLNSSLGDGKKILTAEQLGEFQNGTFKRRGNAQLPDLQIIAGRPKGLLLEYPSLKSLAENASLTATDDIDIAATTADILSQSGELAAEQASAFKNALAPMLSTTGTSIAHPSITTLMTDAVSVNTQQLKNLPRGQLVIFDKTSEASSTRHVMYSLGDGEFFMVNPSHLDSALPADKAIVNAEQFSEEIFKNRKVYAGKISLTHLRMRSLLGQDASFIISGSKLTVTAHGAASNVNAMDASELAEVIRGLGLREVSKVEWSKIKEIELKSCFGAFGSLPTGKVLANLLNKKVTAYPFYFSEKMRDTRNIFTRARIYMPTDLSTIDLEKIAKQQSRNHNLWVKLLRLPRKQPAKRVVRSADLFDNTLEGIVKLANGDTTVGQFLKDYPEYKTGLSVTENELNDLVSETIPDDETFAMRCWDILMLSTYTANLVDTYLEG
ncbi:hypothetical protein [Kosakonia sp. Marseille-Q7440]